MLQLLYGGTTCSVIRLATSDNTEGPYEYQKSIVYSGFDKHTQKNDCSRVTPLHYSFTNISSLLHDGDLYIKDVLNADWADVENIIAPTQTITLNADGTITGLILRLSTSFS